MLLVDTGVFLAAADDNDPDHDACVALLEASTDELVTTGLVVAEAAYLIDRQLGPVAEAGFFRSLSNGDARVETLTASDFARTADQSIDGAVFVDGFFVDSPNPNVQEFVERYKKRFQNPPTLFAMQ